jgi:hypothetical protein
MSYEGPELPVAPASRQRPRMVFYAAGCVSVLAIALIALMTLLNSLSRVGAELVVDKKADLTTLENAHVALYPGATYDEQTIRQIRAATLMTAKYKGIQTDKQVIVLQVPADEKTTWEWYEKKLTEVGYKKTDKTVTIPVAGKKVEQIIFARGIQRLAVQVLPDEEFPGKSIITFSWMLFADPTRPDA